MNIRKKFNNSHLVSDVFIAFIVSSSIILIIFKTKVDLDYSSLIMNMIGVWATLLGFIITAVSILLTVRESKYIKALIDKGKYKELIKVYINTSILLAVALCSFIIFTILGLKYDLLNAALLFISTLAIKRIFTCIRILKGIIELSGASKNESDEEYDTEIEELE